MTTLSIFILNSDFTALKQLPDRYELNLVVPGHSLAPFILSNEYYTDIQVPDGVYLENVIISTSLKPGIFIPTSNVYIPEANQNRATYITCYPRGRNTYRLGVYTQAPVYGKTAYFSQFSVNAKLHLAVSPFT